MSDSSGTIAVVAYTLRERCYLNITNRCTLRCRFCPKFNKQWDIHSYSLRLSREPSSAQILRAIGDPARFREIVFCGLGEPCLRLPVVLSVARALKKYAVPIRLNTDGLANRVWQRDITAQLSGLIDSVSVSLNAQNKTLYTQHCRAPDTQAYDEVLDFVRRVRKAVPAVYISAIDGLPGVDMQACAMIAEKLGVRFRPRVLGRLG